MMASATRATARAHVLFKTQSASVYGIDAYRVEVEVDVGSARMTDFNVVGLPDNAVKESRERIKSALRKLHPVCPGYVNKNRKVRPHVQHGRSFLSATLFFSVLMPRQDSKFAVVVLRELELNGPRL
jgi:hypothetical protein